MRRVLLSVVVCGLLCLCGSKASANLLVNGGAEDGSMNGWSYTPDWSASYNPTSAQAGDYYFKLTDGDDLDKIYQSGTSSVVAGDVFALTGYYTTDAYDWGEAVLAFYDAGDNLLDSATDTYLDPTFNVWTSFSLSLTVPTNAAYWYVELVAHKNPAYGSVTNVDWDTLSLTATAQQNPPCVPVPASMLLLVSGLAGLTRLRKTFAKK